MEYEKKDSPVGKWLRYFFGLAYLPPEEVSDGFLDLMSIAPTTNHTFADYILEQTVLSL